MEGNGIRSQILRFGLFELDLAQARLTCQGSPVRLQEQSFLVLALLLKHPGQIVSREELRQRLWPEGTHVDFEGSLNAVIKSEAPSVYTYLCMESMPVWEKALGRLPDRGF